MLNVTMENPSSRSALAFLPEFYHRYIEEVEEDSLLPALTKSLEHWVSLDLALLHTLADSRYLPDKWSVKEVLQHIIDTERIMAYRALRFARMDKTELPGFDEDEYALHCGVSDRKVQELHEEFILLRKSNILLFASFSAAQLQATGVCSNRKVSVLALGFVLVGHQEHHLRILEERYYPLATGSPSNF